MANKFAGLKKIRNAGTGAATAAAAVTTRRGNPDYVQVSAHILTEQHEEVKIKCIREKRNLSEAIEAGLALWLKAK